jgi:hypothetical protein
MSRTATDRLLARVPLAHALYFVPTSLVALLSRPLFEAVSGRKTDYWLVRTVASLLTVIGVAVGWAGAKDRVTPEIAAVAIGSSAALTAVDVVYVGKRRISPVYLLDGVGNVLLITGWAAALARGAIRLKESRLPE